MGFLKRLFGGGDEQSGGDKDGMYFYVRAPRSGEVIRVRLHRYNDLSLMDDNTNYFARKIIMGTKGFERIEASFTFDKNRNLTSCELDQGELVEQADYDAYQAQLATDEPAANE